MVQLPETVVTLRAAIGDWPRRIGVPPGGRVLLMMDVTRLAWLFRKAGDRFDPKEFIDLFLRALGPEGTLVIPTFNYDLRNGERYDVLRTPTISGALGESALAHPAFKRTANPLHSFAVAGKLQDLFLAAKDPSSFGDRSPFALLKERSFQLVAIDMPLGPAFTYVHFVEQRMRVRYRTERCLQLEYTDGNGAAATRKFELYAKRAGYVNDFKELGSLLRQKKILKEGELDGSTWLSIDLSQAHGIIEDDIKHNRARSIVKFKLRWWLRDVLRPFIIRARPSRSAISLQRQ